MKTTTLQTLTVASLRIHGPTTREGVWQRLRAYRYRCGLDSVRRAVVALMRAGRVRAVRKRRTLAGGSAVILCAKEAS